MKSSNGEIGNGDSQHQHGEEIEVEKVSRPKAGKESEKELTKQELWDYASEKEERQPENASSKFYKLIVQVAKIITSLITMAAILSSAVLSKGLVLFMTSQLSPGKETPYCNKSDISSNMVNDYNVITNSKEQSQWMWSLFLTFVSPQVLIFVDSVRILLFKKFKIPTIKDFFLVSIVEVLHTIGMCLFVFITLPEFDIIRGAMIMNCVSLLPAILHVTSRSKTKILAVIVDVLCIFLQLSGFFLWPFTVPYKVTNAKWATPVSLFLISIGWSLNYVGDQKNIKIISLLNNAKSRLDSENGRHFVYCFVSVLKIGIFFLSMMFFVYLTTPSGQPLPIFEYPFYRLFSRKLTVIQSEKDVEFDINGTWTSETSPSVDYSQISIRDHAPLYTWLIQISASFVCHFFAIFACRIRSQIYSFSFPLTMVIPVTIGLSVGLCAAKSDNVCSLNYGILSYAFWQCPANFFITMDTSSAYIVLWLAWLFSQIWISGHIWKPNNEHLLSTDKLFASPLYCGLLIDQSLMHNRNSDKGIILKSPIKTFPTTSFRPSLNPLNKEVQEQAIEDTEEDNEDEFDRHTHNLTRVYACATMWHENVEEMTGFFISILRLDKDRFVVRYKRANFHYINQDYYVLETHIFFDDAYKFVDPANDDITITVNDFVNKMIQALHEAAKKVYKGAFQIGRPQKMMTPYGGRLVWRLPGRTKLFVHLKDKDKIRHRKRWSQVMYMYYLLSYRLLGSDYSMAAKKERAKHTYILALDGDIDFRPESVRRVVTLMIKDPRIGAACGRIHPVGSGIMAWYQQFEYALGHWLQKATEHVAGCVLCSPGCFSLFRAEALLRPNVMRTYTTKAEEASHYVQYDQGEDRWLCTLLLKQGFKVVYMAASHAYTHCPVSFKEFYNQRRRWVPSTMANIVDLLNDRRKVVHNNESISNLYIAYQWMLMLGAVMGPGTIFLMLVSALNVAFGVANIRATWINLIPLLIFILTCIFAKQKFQLIVAEILTACYALMMIGVLVSLIIQIILEGWLTPSTFFAVALVLVYILAACLHPREFTCLFYFLIYWLVIPSMYLLLIIYSLMNMHDVSWGTREVPGGKSKEQLEQERMELEEMKKNKDNKSFLHLLSRKKKSNTEGSFGLDCAGLCSIKCCTHPNVQDLELQNDMKIIKSALLDLNSKSKPTQKPPLKTNDFKDNLSNMLKKRHLTRIDEIDKSPNSTVSAASANKISAIEDENPKWFQELDGDPIKISETQTEFWTFLINKYLKPLDENKKEKMEISNKLVHLRNQMAYSFFMINIIFAFTILIMQEHKDVLNIKWPKQTNCTIVYKSDDETILISPSYMEMEPIGTFLVLFFGVVLVVQVVGMIIHRWATFTKVMAGTKVKLFGLSNIEEEENQMMLNDKKATQLIKKMADTSSVYTNETLNTKNVVKRRRKSDFEIPRARSVHTQPVDMDDMVDQRISRLARQESFDLRNMPQQTLDRLMERRNSIKLNSEFTLLPRHPIPVIPTPDYETSA
ncbi:hypothetical protein CHUAL_007440 [Chamberlinius hualienensis]